MKRSTARDFRIQVQNIPQDLPSEDEGSGSENEDKEEESEDVGGGMVGSAEASTMSKGKRRKVT